MQAQSFSDNVEVNFQTCNHTSGCILAYNRHFFNYYKQKSSYMQLYLERVHIKNTTNKILLTKHTNINTTKNQNVQHTYEQTHFVNCFKLSTAVHFFFFPFVEAGVFCCRPAVPSSAIFSQSLGGCHLRGFCRYMGHGGSVT